MKILVLGSGAREHAIILALRAEEASAQCSAPVATAIQVAGSVSTTFGGVPRVCRGPSTTCTAPNGGTRTSTELPGAFSASSCSR